MTNWREDASAGLGESEAQKKSGQDRHADFSKAETASRAPRRGGEEKKKKKKEGGEGDEEAGEVDHEEGDAEEGEGKRQREGREGKEDPPASTTLHSLTEKKKRSFSGASHTLQVRTEREGKEQDEEEREDGVVSD